ncbi:MAG: zinc-dependent metalloprotease [Sphingosinicella sp.]|uniref:zinc-dependent metalloprotease n=1 Tax=Sphingosinicella sp. TaxID=1917971 RepID=UPI004037E86F
MSLRLACLLLLALLSAPALAIDPPAQVLQGTSAQSGLLTVHVDRRQGRILLALPAPDAQGISGRFVYVSALETGLGSAPIGLDRGLASGSKILVFRRVGRRVAAEIENSRFRAPGGTLLEQAGVRTSFAYSTIWMGEVAAETADGGFLVDVASFIARDDLGIAQALRAGNGGEFRLVPELSVADPNAVRVFPENVELEGRLTFVSAAPTAEVNNISPVNGNLSFIVRHSLIRLPEPGYVQRRFDPRAGSFGTQVVDYSQPLGAPIVYELANRFRLERLDPGAPRSRVRRPIVFYIDRAAPEPIRTALYEGVDWWREAFERAGYIDAFRVEYLPEDADPLDVRYNVVHWVSRATRGWSYGQVIEDPRTGEIIRGQVLLGSLRVRQDMLIFEGLVGAGQTGTGGPDDPVRAALARIRQLAAHEVGHALGLAHNFAASTQDRYSVMDYPAPRIALVNGVPSIADAYGVGVGRWDLFAVDWLYGTDSDAEGDRRMAAGLAEGLRFVGDGEARPPGSAQPYGSLWDDFADPVAELTRMMAVRQAAVARFGPHALYPGEPVSNLRRKFVPIWLLHRYQVEAAVKLVGGVEFAYSRNGDGQEAARVVDLDRQRAALDALIATLTPQALAVPEGLLPYLSAGWSGSTDRQEAIEIFRTAGANIFDPLIASEVAAQHTLNNLLAPDRLNRLEIQSRGASDWLTPADLFERLIAEATRTGGDASEQLLRRRVGTAIVLAIARVQRDPALSPTVALALSDRLARLERQLAATGGGGAQSEWSRGLGRLLGDNAALTAALAEQRRIPQIPPGMPIGGGE